MKTITIHIEDSKYSFLINLLKRFSFVQIEQEEDTEVFTEKQKRILDQRLDELLKGKTETVDWESLQDILK